MNNREKGCSARNNRNGDSSKRCYSTDFKDEMNIPPHQNSSGVFSNSSREIRLQLRLNSQLPRPGSDCKLRRENGQGLSLDKNRFGVFGGLGDIRLPLGQQGKVRKECGRGITRHSEIEKESSM